MALQLAACMGKTMVCHLVKFVFGVLAQLCWKDKHVLSYWTLLRLISWSLKAHPMKMNKLVILIVRDCQGRRQAESEWSYHWELKIVKVVLR